MEEKLKSAYHEAGHCFRAWDYHSVAIRSVCLRESDFVPGGWEGELNYKKSWFPEEGLRFVALAGVLAEAKAVSSEGQAAARNVASSAALAAAIWEIVANQLPDAAGPLGWNIPVPVVGHANQAANISRADLLQIPPADRTEALIAEALAQTCTFINNPAHWRIISELAIELDRLAPKCFDAFRIFLIIDEAIRDTRAEADPGEA